jgi:hypothetical protein
MQLLHKSYIVIPTFEVHYKIINQNLCRGLNEEGITKCNIFTFLTT